MSQKPDLLPLEGENTCRVEVPAGESATVELPATFMKERPFELKVAA
jgi:hypothetical protein